MKTTVYKNASIVTGLSVAERGLGFLYRIVLSRLIGAEGVGLYQVALSLFSLFLTIGTGGIPITVSRMIAKGKAEKDEYAEQSAVSAGLILCLLLTLPVCFLLWTFGGKMTFLFSDQRCFEVFRILLVGLCFSCIYAVIRGYFWGNKQFFAPSILEISEETVMVIAGVLLLRGVSSPLAGAKNAAWAVIISYLFSCTASLCCFFLHGGKLTYAKKELKPLFNAAMPITSVRASSSLVNSAIAVLLPVMLVKSGLSEAQALSLFGVVSGMVLPVLFIPSTLIGSLALVLVPELSEDFYRKNHLRLKKNIERGLRFSFLLACALIPFFYALGEDVGRLAFSNAAAGEIIQKSSPILLPMSLTMISTAMLNSMGYEKQTFIFYFVGAAAMLLCVLFLPSFCGIYAYVLGLFFSFLLTALCNLIFLYKKCPVFQNRRGQVRVPFLFCGFIFILPISLLGQLCNQLFHRFMGAWTCVLFTGAIMLIFTFSLYFVFDLLPKRSRILRSS